MREHRFPNEIIEVIKNALPPDTAVSGQTPDLKYTFIPAGHARALHPDAMLIEGIRGSGKSFWWNALQSEDHRRMLAYSMPKTELSEKTIVSVGFGESSRPYDYPGKDILLQLCKKFDTRQIWRTIIYCLIAKQQGPDNFELQKDNWNDRVEWLLSHAEEVERYLFDADRKLEKSRVYHLCIFDALDRTADDWPTLAKLIRGLLQALLEFRSYQRIRLKAFIRPDHLEDPKTRSFPDSSKILTQKVELRWPRNELYGLLWQYLSNTGDVFRENCQEILSISWRSHNNVWIIPPNLRNDEESQRKVFHALTGPWMGRDRRRGIPYTWLPNHLGDAGGQVSPRSFLAAIRHAAQDGSRADYGFPLYYESIKRGVQEASKIRVREMEEDYPWVNTLMKPLEGITVPCLFEQISGKWSHLKILDLLTKDVTTAGVKLPPVHLAEGADGVRLDLETLGVFQGMTDGRVNLPDVYRVGYGLGRKGGVKAVARYQAD